MCFWVHCDITRNTDAMRWSRSKTYAESGGTIEGRRASQQNPRQHLVHMYGWSATFVDNQSATHWLPNLQSLLTATKRVRSCSWTIMASLSLIRLYLWHSNTLV